LHWLQTSLPWRFGSSLGAASRSFSNLEAGRHVDVQETWLTSSNNAQQNKFSDRAGHDKMSHLPPGALPLQEDLEDIAMEKCMECAVNRLVLQQVLSDDGSGALHGRFHFLGKGLCGRQDCNMCSEQVLPDLIAWRA
jgi:hypothetical protein